jgi:long-chain acyl-CoA synthetase
VGGIVTEMASTGSLSKLLWWRAAERPDFPLTFVEEEGPWTVGSIAAAATQISRHLPDRPGRVIVRLGNDERFLAALTAVWLQGGSAVVVHPAAPGADVDQIVRSMGVGALIQGVESQAPTGSVPTLVVPRLPRDAATTDEPHSVPAVDDGDEALVLLTSGSTGEPKGVLLTHGSGWSNLAATVSAFRSDTRPTPISSDGKPPNLIANPVSHTAGVVRILFALYVGRPFVLLRKFVPLACHRAITRHRIDNLTINPTMIRMLLDALPVGADLGSVRYVSSGTAPLTTSLREEFEVRFGVPVLQAYGQTEAFGGVAVEPVKDVLAGRRRPDSVGKALPGVEIRIGADEEILVRTPSVTAGYLGGEVSPVDRDGWLHTGDTGRLDDDGYLYVTGRLKNIIICGGFNIVPEEVEAAIAVDEAVRDVAVLGVPDDRLGEVPVAVAEASDQAEAILARVAGRLAPYKRPRRLLIVDALPRVPNGKVDRPALARVLKGIPT